MSYFKEVFKRYGTTEGQGGGWGEGINLLARPDVNVQGANGA